MRTADTTHDSLILFDVGARGGIDERWQGLDVEVIGFEPDPEKCERLNKVAEPRKRFLPFALGDTRETMTLHVAAPPGPPLRPVEARTMEVLKLDDVCREQGWFDVLRLAAEGAELDVLRGGPEALRHAIAIDVAMSFAPLRIGAPLFPEVNGYLVEQGFALAGLRRVFWRHKSGRPVLVQADGLYLHEERFTGPKAELVLAAYAPEAEDAWGDSGFF